jgi:hypothetical protein
MHQRAAAGPGGEYSSITRYPRAKALFHNPPPGCRRARASLPDAPAMGACQPRALSLASRFFHASAAQQPGFVPWPLRTPGWFRARRPTTANRVDTARLGYDASLLDANPQSITVGDGGNLDANPRVASRNGRPTTHLADDATAKLIKTCGYFPPMAVTTAPPAGRSELYRRLFPQRRRRPRIDGIACSSRCTSASCPTLCKDEVFTVSHHLGMLQQAGLVKTRKQGRFVVCFLPPDARVAAQVANQ